MIHYGKHYIDGRWVEPANSGQKVLIDPFIEAPFATVATGGSAGDVDKAVAAARQSFETYSRTSVEERIALIDRIIAAYEERVDEIAHVMAQEVGIPVSARAQATGPIGHFKVARDLLRTYRFETRLADTIIRREPIGVCALISPWNWPMQTPAIKAIYGLAAGCTIVLKPSDASPVSAIILAEIFEKAGVPKGVFNLVIGRGSEVGAALSSHPDVDMISFTGSTQAGARVGEAAARTVKRVSLELGGKSANIVLMDADLEKAARWNIQRCFFNAGQSCHAPSRMLVHESQVDEVIPYLVDEAGSYRLGDPRNRRPPWVRSSIRRSSTASSVTSRSVWTKGRLVCGGVGRPDGRNQGYFVKPTVFADVAPDMTIAKEEIFGPVLVVIPYSSEKEALEIANDSPYGLGGYVFGTDRRKAYEFATGLRAGRFVSTARRPTPSRRWAATNSPGLAARWEFSALRSTWR